MHVEICRPAGLGTDEGISASARILVQDISQMLSFFPQNPDGNAALII